MKRKIISFISIIALTIGIIPLNISVVNAENTLSFTKLREVDKWSFNEYWYKITKAYTELDEAFQVDYVLDSTVLNKLLTLTEEARKFLPDDLNNESKYNKAKIALKKWLKYPNNDTYFENIRKSLENFIEKAKIDSLKGSIIATPKEWNAPLNTTLRAEIEDPSGTQISRNAYIWWMNVNGKRKIIGTKPSMNYTFIEEGTFTVFLDVKSSHKNSFWNRDVLPYSNSVKIKVKEKIASVILRISWQSLNFDNEIKFAPDNAGFGLIFDATSSVAASWTKFVTTTWDFWNGVKKSNSGSPRIERVIYSREWNYDALLKLKTNQGKIIEKHFRVLVHKPIASISVHSTDWFMWDNFVFKAKSYWDIKHLSYSWKIIDTKNDKQVAKKNGSVFTYAFKEKWQYSIALQIKDAAGNIDVDTKTININSRAPIANFKTSIPYSNKPNKIFFDGTSSYDPDYSDDGNLKYTWTIDGQKLNLEESNENWSNGFYTFSTIWDHSVVLEVEDLDEITSILRSSVKVNSLLDVDFSIYPRVVQREQTVRFIAESKEAKFYEWDFGDWEVKSKASSKISHTYNKSWTFSVKLTVRWENRSKNTYIKNVYVGDSKNPVSVIDITRKWAFNFRKEQKVCWWKEAYIISRKDNLVLSWKESIDTNGKNSWLSYSWIVWQWKYKNWQSINERFDELGCYRIKLTVKSNRDKTTNSSEIWVKVKNMNPIISGLKIVPVDLNTDPVIVNVTALWTKDPDGVIQSYLWYYTTDIDNEAQDFRITQNSKTTFVIPKIQGTYYFGVMMKDNNGAKVNSEDLVNKIWNNFVELQWDNSNTPLIDFTSSDSSVSIWEEISFRAVAKNIRWDSIEKTAKFSWDFDWDWFYDAETDKWTITYKYKKSWTFYPKVKVRNKGFSNTRTLTMSVSNKLTSNFKYVSIWNKYIFVDSSKWTIDKNSWNLWDWTKEENKDKFIHKYSDKESVHFVELTVVEWTKVKKTIKEVEKDLRNLIKTRKKWLNVFTFPWLNKEWTIILKEEESIFIYMWESKWDFEYYGIDYNILKDSDINGWKDDDIDNKNNSSYKNGTPDEITLDNNREQTIRLFLLDKEWNTVDSKDILIIKEYIEEKKEIKLWEFTWVTDNEKAKIEKLKIAISKLPQQHRIKSMQFVQKMQENWSDETEKVRTIIAFEEFLNITWYENADNIIDLLESLISEDFSDEKAVAFEALKALIPNDIQCSVETWTCKEWLIEKLVEIKNNSDTENNRELWKQILTPISKDKTMSPKQKNNFKWILQILVYSWVNNVPQDIKNEVQKEDKIVQWDKENEAIEWTDLGGFLKSAGWWITGIVWIIFLIMFVFWMIDFLKNRKNWESFEDFVDNKTSDKEENVLWDFTDPLETTKEDVVIDPLQEENNKPSAMFSNSEETSKVKVEKVEDIKVEEVEKVEEIKIDNTEESIPDWLSWNIEEKEEVKTEEVKVEEVEKIEEEKIDNTEESIPDWLSWNIEEKEEVKKEEIKTEEVEKIEEEKVEEKIEKIKEIKIEKENKKIEKDFGFSLDIPEEEKIEEITKVTEEKEVKDLDFDIAKDNTSDWLKDSLTDKLPKIDNTEDSIIVENKKKEEKEEELEPVVIEDKVEEKLKLDSDDDIPDWLKGSLDEKKEEKEEKKENKKEVIDKKEVIEKKEKNKLDDDDIPDWLKGSLEEKKEEKKEKNKEEKKNKIEKDWWDDDTNIPDWLKTD